jgi:hypothetical protein
MSSDNPIAGGLSPDYEVPWEKLFQQLVRFLLCKDVSVEIWNDGEMAVIKSKGCILGRVSSVENDISWDDRQHVDITSKNTPGYLGQEMEWSARWTLQAPAMPIRKDDLICLLQGVSKPTIIRLYKDYFAIIAIASTPVEDVRAENGRLKWPELSRLITIFPREFLLIWHWEKSYGRLQDQEEYESLRKNYSRASEHSSAGLEDDLDQAVRLRNVVSILEDSEVYEEAGELLRRVMGSYKRILGEEHPQTLTIMDDLALVLRNTKQWKEAEELCLQVIWTRKRVQGVKHPDTLSSIANLQSTYRDQGHLEGVEELVTHLLDQQECATDITEEVVIDIAGLFNKEVMTLLLEGGGDKVRITEEVVKAVAQNDRSGEEVMTLLLDRRGHEVQITKEVVKAAVENNRSGEEVMRLLLDRRGDEVQITEEIVKVVAGSEYSRIEVMALLLDRRGHEVQITEEVLKAAAGNNRSGEEVMTLLLDRRGDKIQITEEVVKTAARNEYSGEEVMRALLDRRGHEVRTTKEVIEAALENTGSGDNVITLLMDPR